MSDDRKALTARSPLVDRLRTTAAHAAHLGNMPTITALLDEAANAIAALQPGEAAQAACPHCSHKWNRCPMQGRWEPILDGYCIGCGQPKHAAPPSVPAAQGDAKDAARYRWLRSQRFHGEAVNVQAVEDAIDAALAAQGEQAGGEQG